jgi:hypothetical protein
VVREVLDQLPVRARLVPGFQNFVMQRIIHRL